MQELVPLLCPPSSAPPLSLLRARWPRTMPQTGTSEREKSHCEDRHNASSPDSFHDHIDAHNEAPHPFIWTAKAEKILEKVGRARAPQISQQQSETLH